MTFRPERLMLVREQLGINKAEAARRLNMSAMGYGRYENGQREPSFQTVSFIASTFNTTPEFLYGMVEDPSASIITISSIDQPELFSLVKSLQEDKSLERRLLAYLERIAESNNCNH